MKLYKFVKAQKEEEGAFSLSDVNQNAPELYQKVQKLSTEEIYNLLFSKQFVPLDFVALIYRLNPGNFSDAIKKHIYYLLKQNTKYQSWLKEMNLNLSDASGLIFEEMLSDDPMKRGILNQINLDGSYANSYRYEREENIPLSNKIKDTLGISQGIAVPHCPTCKELGIRQPLWEYEIDGNKIKTKFHMYKERCTNIENVKTKQITGEQAGEILEKAPSAEIIQEDPTSVIAIGNNLFMVTIEEKVFIVELTPEQLQALTSSQRGFELHKGHLIFRCTFKAMIPAFTAFFGYTTVNKEISDLWRKWQQSLGRDVDTGKLEKYKELLEKSRTEEGLTREEKAEFESLRKYKERRDKQMVMSPQSIDTSIKSESGDKDRSLHEMVSKTEDGGDFNPEDVKEAELNLSDFLEEDEFELLTELKNYDMVFLTLLNEYKRHAGMKRKDLKPEDTEKILQAYVDVAKAYLREDSGGSTCAICGFQGGEKDKVCNVAVKMRRDLYDFYVKSSGVTDFLNKLKNLDEKAQKHFEMSQIRQIILDLLSTEVVEVDEDDIEVIDLSGFKDKEKLSFEEFIKEVKDRLPTYFVKVFDGQTMQAPSEKESKPIDQKRVERVVKRINQLIAKVDEGDLFEELLTFHRA